VSVVNYETGEIVEVDYGMVKRSIERAKASLEEAAEQIVWQIEHRAWEVLGYGDWNEMREAEYGGAAFMVPRAERPELVARMRQSGLTTTEIADTAGVSDETVRRDLHSTNVDSGPITNARGQQRPASYSARPVPPPAPEHKVDAAVSEFPDLAYYAETGQERDVVAMADDLRRYRKRGELDARLDTLRRSIAVDRAKRDGTHQAGMTAVMGQDGEYRMEPLPTPITRTCPTCSGRGVIKEQTA
jgi:hypothetical protein